MKDFGMNTSVEELLHNADWVNRVARSLVYDRGLADDVAQETWLAALQAQPRQIRNPRGWLGGVARNISQGMLRSKARRDVRERAAAKPEASFDSEEVTERAALQRRVADLVLELEEPFRSTLLLRFFDGLSPREVAQRMEVPVDTVYSRQHRALAQIRQKLDREFGDRKTWGMLFLPLAQLVSPKVGAAVLLKGAVAVTLLVAGAATFFSTSSWISEEIVLTPLTAQSAPQPIVEPVSLEKAREVMESYPQAAPKVGEEASSKFRIFGQVLEPHGSPLSGVKMGWVNNELGRFLEEVGLPAIQKEVALSAVDWSEVNPLLDFSWKAPASARQMTRQERIENPWKFIGLGEPVATKSDSGGRFELFIPKKEGTVVPLQPEYVLLANKNYPREADDVEILRIVAPVMALSGLVVDEQGYPISGASVSIEPISVAQFNLPNEMLDGLREAKTQPTEQNALTNEKGRFHLGRVPKFEEVKFSAYLEGYEWGNARLSDAVEGEIQFVLKKIAPKIQEKLAIEGRVVDLLGRPAGRADVQFAQWQCYADMQGFFRLELDTFSPPAHYAAKPLIARGKEQVAVLESFGQEFCKDPERGKGLILTLKPLLSISGMVLGPSGAPAVGVGVIAHDATFIGTSNHAIEFRPSGVGLGIEPSIKTDAEGRFVLPQLLQKSYRLRIWDPQFAFGFVTEPIEAGSKEAVIRIPPEAVRAVVRGQLVSRSGLPLPEVTIRLCLDSMNTQGHRSFSVKTVAKSDADGRFELRNVPRWESSLTFESQEVFQTHYRIPPEALAEELRIQLPLRCPMKIVALDGENATDYRHLELLDSEGKKRVFTTRFGESVFSSDHAPLHGKTVIVEAPDDVKVLVFYQNHKEVKRVPLRLEPGRMQTVEV